MEQIALLQVRQIFSFPCIKPLFLKFYGRVERHIVFVGGIV